MFPVQLKTNRIGNHTRLIYTQLKVLTVLYIFSFSVFVFEEKSELTHLNLLGIPNQGGGETSKRLGINKNIGYKDENSYMAYNRVPQR